MSSPRPDNYPDSESKPRRVRCATMGDLGDIEVEVRTARLSCSSTNGTC